MKIGEKRIATVKHVSQISEIASSESVDGWHLKGQYFPRNHQDLCGKTFEFVKEWLYCWSVKINNQYYFLAEEALIFKQTENEQN